MNWKKTLTKLAKQKRAMVGLEAAIILIAFVIIAGAFSFMVINQGLFATERGKTAIQEGIKQASTPLCVDGSIFLRTNSSGNGVDAIVIPLRAYGVKYVAMEASETVITLKVGADAWPSIYRGVDDDVGDPTNSTLDNLVGNVTDANTAELFIQNNNAATDTSLDADEKGYLVINLDGTEPSARTHIVIEIRPEKSAPLTIDFYIPESLPTSEWITVGG